LQPIRHIEQAGERLTDRRALGGEHLTGVLEDHEAPLAVATPRSRPRWPSFWCHFGKRDHEGLGWAWLEFDFRVREDGEVRRQHAFGAGLTFLEAPGREALERLTGSHPDLVSVTEGGLSRVSRHLPLDDLASFSDSPDSQISCLADFAVETFEALTSEVPPEGVG